MEKSLGKEFSSCRELPVQAPETQPSHRGGQAQHHKGRAERARQTKIGSTLILSMAPTPPPTITTLQSPDTSASLRQERCLHNK